MANIEAARAQQYATEVEQLAQQQGAQGRLRGAVTEKSFAGTKGGKIIEQLDTVAMQNRIGRGASLSLVFPTHDAPWVHPSFFEVALGLDNFDAVQTLADFGSPYVASAAHASGRQSDDVIIAAFFATRYKGENGTDTQAFPSTQQIAVDTGGSAATGLNVEKLIKAKMKFMRNEVDVDMEGGLNIAVSADEIEFLYRDPRYTSREYGDPVFDGDGRLKRYLGYNFIHTERLTLDGSGYRRNPVWVKSGVALGMWEMMSNITRRDDLSGQPLQIYLSQGQGATRTEEVKVAEIKNTVIS